ncbi:MAG TPA: ABC transporter ATP-binding protein [Nitriliruptorales bacterium]
MSTPEPALRMHGLSKRYRHVPVLDELCFDAPAGALALVTGTNGAGKSTLLRCLAGLTSFTGSAWFRGERLPGSIATRRHIGYLPQDVGFPEAATVGEVLELFCGLRRAAPDSTGLADGFVPDADAQVGTLSGGQRQRLATAIALLGRPELLLLDEPTANLDSWARGSLWETLRAHRREGATILVASPREDEVVGSADLTLNLSADPVRGPHALAELATVRGGA